MILFECEYCKKCFTRKLNLIRHYNRKYKCNHEIEIVKLKNTFEHIEAKIESNCESEDQNEEQISPKIEPESEIEFLIRREEENEPIKFNKELLIEQSIEPENDYFTENRISIPTKKIYFPKKSKRKIREKKQKTEKRLGNIYIS